MDKLQPQRVSDLMMGMQAGQAPAPMTHNDRINRLEQQLAELTKELQAVADSHSGRLSQLEAKVG